MFAPLFAGQAWKWSPAPWEIIVAWWFGLGCGILLWFIVSRRMRVTIRAILLAITAVAVVLAGLILCSWDISWWPGRTDQNPAANRYFHCALQYRDYSIVRCSWSEGSQLVHGYISCELFGHTVFDTYKPSVIILTPTPVPTGGPVPEPGEQPHETPTVR